MPLEQLFVGTVATILGVGALLAAIGNADSCYQLRKVQWLEGRAGRGFVRAVYAFLGVGLIVLGVAIALGKTGWG